MLTFVILHLSFFVFSQFMSLNSINPLNFNIVLTFATVYL